MKLNIEEIKKANEEMNKKMKEIYAGIYYRDRYEELPRKSPVLWDALIDLGSEVQKGKISVEDARKRMTDYIKYMYAMKLSCALKGNKFYAEMEMLDIWSFEEITKKLKNSGKVSVL